MNSGLALHVLESIRTAGVRTICVCPGARNAEWVKLLAEQDLGFEVYWFFEERSAAFFALGRMKRTLQPTAIVTTSGTAVGELLPATMEAFYSDLPLFLLTADRPRRFRGSGAPQAAEQVGLFGIYAPRQFDLEDPERLLSQLNPHGKPLHLNVCFEDPKGAVDRPAPGLWHSETSGDPLERIDNFQRPLVVVGALKDAERFAVESFLHRLQAPVYLEALSGLRDSSLLDPWKITVGDQLLRRSAAAGYPPDGVIRIGGIPTHRLWRDLEDRESEIDVISISSLGFSGLGRTSTLIQGDLSMLLETVAPSPIHGDGKATLLEEDRVLYQCLKRALDSEPDSEASLLRTVSETMPCRASVYLGNSLPIREWDLASTWEARGYEFYASRGLNGIDGQISTFLGACSPDRTNWAILGDLTSLYDLTGPWPFGQLPKDIDATLIILNNCGGKIFDRMFESPKFQNTHHLSFEPWAKLWGLGYERVDSAEQLRGAVSKNFRGLRVIEVRPNPASTHRFWTSFQEALA